MEVAPTSDSHGHADEPPLPEPPPSPHHPRRHIRYASPEASSVASPHAFVHNSHHPQNRSPPPTTMNASQPAVAAYSSNHTTPGSPTPPEDLIVPDGQNHDRMETDDDTDESGSDSGTDTPEQSEATTEPAPQPSVPAGEAMDTTPDVPLGPAAPVAYQSPALLNPVAPIPVNSTTVHMSVTATLGMNPTGGATLLDNPSLTFSMNGVDQPSGEIRVTIPNAALEAARGGSRQPPPPQREDSVDSRTRRERRADPRERDANEARDEDSDDSSDDEENPYWASFKEDTSSPDEREVKVIEESEKNLPTAIDHEHWEKSTFEPLDDPEYLPADVGRISWTVNPVHGTPDKPMKEKIMKSPSVRIGDFYWNIKYYPRGNDGTEQVSVYVECSPVPYENAKSKEIGKGVSHTNEDTSVSDTTVVVEQKSAASNQDEQILPDGSAATDPSSTPLQSSQTLPSQPAPEAEKHWRVAAQVCCIMYNPTEPTVYASQKSCHSYYHDNPDWGWTRFHGPWDDLHQRKRYQRQALLRNDTLAFTAYIRIVNDKTKALWWHPPKDRPVWDSLEMTGIRAFKCIRAEQPSAIIAALSAWLHLRPFLQTLRDTNIPDGFTEPDKRPKPLVEELMNLVTQVGEYSNKHKDLSLSLVATLMEVNSVEGIKKMDVIALWEHLRRLLTVEVANADSVEAACTSRVEAFKDILLLKQPDPFGLDPYARKYQPIPRDCPPLPSDHEPKSVQDVIDVASQQENKAFRVWECFPQQPQEPPRNPRILKIELHRQHYDKAERAWMKLGHRIKLDDQITFSNTNYTLYGMIVHTGSLESQEYYSVIRPGGPRSRWIKYAGESSPRKVSILTTKQAVTAHEGKGEPIMSKKQSEKKRENAAVAYIAMYVRTDCLPDVLVTPFDSTVTNVSEESLDPAAGITSGIDTASDKTPAQIPVYFYSGNTFSGSDELEIFNPWAHGDGNEQDTCRVSIPETTKVREVKAILELLLSQTGEQTVMKELKLWLLDMRKPCLGALPAFHSLEKHADDALEIVTLFSEGCRFWVGGQEHDLTRKLFQKLGTSDFAQLLEDLQKPPAPPTADQALPTQEDPNNGGEAPSAVSTNVVIEESGEREEGEVVESGDTVMGEAQDTNSDPTPPLATSNENQAPPEASNDLLSNRSPEVLCFLKLFDWENQNLQSVNSFSAPFASNVVAEVKKAMGIDLKPKSDEDIKDTDQLMKDSDQPEEVEWDVYHERFQFVKTHDLVAASATFESHTLSTEFLPGDIQIIVPTDGACFIAQRRPSPEQIAALEAAGKPTNVPQYIQHLLGRAYNPTLSLPHRTTSVFGSPYFSGSQSYARPHGPGTLITMIGDHYTGPFASGQKAGSDGKMIFANGDEYVGDWAADAPHGEGEMKYLKTENLYTGGWKRGKRHGKGRMDFKVADEEMKLCQVCYEDEMDSLFYACGHVCACEACAKQVETCPVCRERVRGVVKVRWTV